MITVESDVEEIVEIFLKLLNARWDLIGRNERVWTFGKTWQLTFSLFRFLFLLV